MKNVYLILSIFGIAIPYYFGFLIVRDTGGFDLMEFINQATINNSARFLAGDLSVVALTAAVFIVYEGLRNNIKYWWISIVVSF